MLITFQKNFSWIYYYVLYNIGRVLFEVKHYSFLAQVLRKLWVISVIWIYWCLHYWEYFGVQLRQFIFVVTAENVHYFKWCFIKSDWQAVVPLIPISNRNMWISSLGIYFLREFIYLFTYSFGKKLIFYGFIF